MNAIRSAAWLFICFLAAIAWVLGTFMALLALGLDYIEEFFFWLFGKLLEINGEEPR